MMIGGDAEELTVNMVWKGDSEELTMIIMVGNKLKRYNNGADSVKASVTAIKDTVQKVRMMAEDRRKRK